MTALFEHIKEFKVLPLNNAKVQDLTEAESSWLKEFTTLLEGALESGKAQLFYRGNDENSVKARIKEAFKSEEDNNPMAILWLSGEKAKSYLKSEEEISKAAVGFISSIAACDQKAFEALFDRFHGFLSDSIQEEIEAYAEQNADVIGYFRNKENKKAFSTAITDLAENKKIAIRNYYMRVLHTLYGTGKENELSYFLSLSTKLEVAQGFAGAKEPIIFYYWLPEPVIRFGHSEESMQAFSAILQQHSLPVCAQEFYPDEHEFTLFGAMFPHHIIGYQKGDVFILSPHVANEDQKYEEALIERGFKIDQHDLSDELVRKTEYLRVVTLDGNRYFNDKKV